MYLMYLIYGSLIFSRIIFKVNLSYTCSVSSLSINRISSYGHKHNLILRKKCDKKPARTPIQEKLSASKPFKHTIVLK